MMKFLNEFTFEESGFIDAHIEKFDVLSSQIMNQISADCLSFSQFHAQVISQAIKYKNRTGLWIDTPPGDPVNQLLFYTNSLYNTYWQVLYSIVRLDTIAFWVTSTGGTNTIINYYISFYFSGCLSSIKTTTDVIGLLVNHLFKLNVEFKKCGLEKSFVAQKLLGANDLDNTTHIKKLSHLLHQERNGWIQDFYKFRNTVIHRDEIRSMAIPINFNDPSIPSHPFSIHPSPHDKTSLNIVKKISPTSIILENAISPIVFCSEIRGKLANLLEKMSIYCGHEIDFFISRYKT